MEEVKLNQSRLNQICYILGSYDYDTLCLYGTDESVFVFLGGGTDYVPMFVLHEISGIMGSSFGVCVMNGSLALFFDKENPDEELSIPDDLKA